MEYILAIDDTDNLDSPGTGEHLENIVAILERDTGSVCSRVTRHQLFFSPQVKYTSHNSAMSAIVQTEVPAEDIFATACNYLKENAAQGSDPGVCLLCKDTIKSMDCAKLKEYGQRTKKEYIEKQEAYDVAKAHGIMLKELGGEGIGVIGALAGAALRLDGNDGRYKGKFMLEGNPDNMRCKDILSHPYIDEVMTEDWKAIPEDAEVFVTDQIKTVNRDNRSVLLVKQQQTEGGKVYVNLSRQELKKY